MESYSVSARAYLTRARKCLAEGTAAQLFYAAFELRCGVEARLQEYLHPHDFVPDVRKLDWQVGKLHKTTLETFQLGDRVARLIIRRRKGGPILMTLYYTPVTARLKQIAQVLGDYLHAGKYHAPADEYWEHYRALLEEGITLLSEATTGTLLGPLIRHKGSNDTSLPMELLPDTNGVFGNPLLDMPGKKVIVEVSYHDNLAAAVAPAV